MDFATIFGNAFREAIGPNAAFYAVLALGLNVHYGYTGLLNFGQVGFAIAGAYGLGIAVATWGLSMWAGLFLADHHGLFRAAGLDVTIAPGGPGRPGAGLAVVAGEADLGIASDLLGVLRLVADGAPLVLLGATMRMAVNRPV